MSLILVDMDGVIVDWGKAYGEALDELGDMAEGIPRHESQKTFNIHEGLTERQQGLVSDIMDSISYYWMDEIPGAVDALHGMVDHGHDVVICTSPWLSNEKCVEDKLYWVARHLGNEWTDRVVITKDKTLVHGDWLIDDKPKITGRVTHPAWEQIIFDQPYNKTRRGERLKSWDRWDNRRFE